MSESQNIEYKESWRPEYLKWVCGFANAQGGTIYIGIDDAGRVVGPVSYHGEYHYRSGSTKQQLQGSALTEFIREKTGYLWDAIPVDNIGVNDLDRNSIDIFRREAVRKKRMEKEDLDITNEELLDHLDLLADGKLKRAAVMLFYHKPGRLVTGCYVKIGKFGKGSDLQYQDTVEGSLFSIADRVIDLIYTKYLKAAITYERDVRVETYPFPREGVREAVYNALGHNNYAASIPIQIRIEDDAMYISNSCILPKNWTVETLMQRHKSEPFNPSIANAFYRAGYIEAWGRGIQKICEACREPGTADPEYTVTGSDLTVKFTAFENAKVSDFKIPKYQFDTLDDTLDRKILILLKERPTITQSELAVHLGVSVPSIKRTMKKLLESGSVTRKGGRRFGHWEVKHTFCER